MKITRKNKPVANAETFYLAMTYSHADVRRVLTDDLEYMCGEALSKDFWIEVIGHFLTQIGTQRKKMSVCNDVGEWAFNIAVRYKYLIPDVEENLYVINDKLLAQSKSGPKPKEED